MKPRVMVVDDSVVVRRTLGAILEADPDLQLAGSAATGERALQELLRLDPDVLILDLEMPGLDGLEILRQLRLQGRDLPVIMYSSPTERSARATMEALAAGAQDFVLKPDRVVDPAAARAAIESELLAKIKEICGCREWRRRVGAAAQQPAGPERRRSSDFGLLAIGCSTGGPNALGRILPGLPETLPVPVVIVQHMPALFIDSLAERLDQLSPLRVKVAEDGEALQAGTAYLAPGERHAAVNGTGGILRIQLLDTPPRKSCRPAVDVTLQTAAAAVPRAVLAAILTGMGEDGLDGCRAVHAAGGELLLQDRQTSVVWGMPGAVAGAGLPAQILPLENLAEAMSSILMRRGARGWS